MHPLSNPGVGHRFLIGAISVGASLFPLFNLEEPQGLLLYSVGWLIVTVLARTEELDVGNKAVIITGCDSGFGHSLAKRLDAMGMIVFAGCLFENGPGAQALKTSCSEKLRVIQVDVTNEEQVRAAVGQVEDTLNELGHQDGMWGLVNNAGAAYAAELEMIPHSVFSKMIDINLMGTVRVTQAFLPLIKTARGRVVNVSSLAGRIPAIYFGAYTATKHAIEGYSSVLRAELQDYDVKVSVIQPSAFVTNQVQTDTLKSHQHEIWNATDDVVKETYNEDRLKNIYEGLQAQVDSRAVFSKDLTPVLASIQNALLARTPCRNYPCGRGAGAILLLNWIMPEWIRDSILKYVSLHTHVKERKK